MSGLHVCIRYCWHPLLVSATRVAATCTAGLKTHHSAKQAFKLLMCCIMLRCVMPSYDQAVEADDIDILAVQAPNCKQLPDSLIDLLQTARTSLLVYNHRADDSW